MPGLLVRLLLPAWLMSSGPRWGAWMPVCLGVRWRIDRDLGDLDDASVHTLFIPSLVRAHVFEPLASKQTKALKVSYCPGTAQV